MASDLREQRFVEHTLQIAIQAALDVASHIVSDRRLGEPRTNRELPVQDQRDRRRGGVGHRLVDQEPAIARDIVRRPVRRHGPSAHDARRKERHRRTGLERRTRGSDGHGHQRRVGRQKVELPAVGAPARRRAAHGRHLRFATRVGKGLHHHLEAARFVGLVRDGTLLYEEFNPKTGSDLWTLSPDGKTSPLRVTPFNEGMGQFSPGAAGGPRWVAYASDDSERIEAYVQSYPAGTSRIAVSDGGGSEPMWSPDGTELFHLTGDAVVAVAVRSDRTFGAPRRLFDRSNHYLRYGYDVSPDGRRFLMIRRDEGSVPRQLNVILNGSDEGEAASGGRGAHP